MLIICPGNSYGEIELSTGVGMPDPAFEHLRPIPSISLSNSSKPIPYSFHKVGPQVYNLAIPINKTYTFNWPKYPIKLPDLRFELKANPRSYVLIDLIFPYSDLYVFRFYGSKIPQVLSQELLENASYSCWYHEQMDSSSHVLLKMVVPDSGEEEAILFAEKFETNLISGGKPMLLSIRPQEGNTPEKHIDLFEFEYVLAESARVSLTIFDSYGENGMEMVNEKQAAGKHTMRIPRSKLPSDYSFLFYVLTIDDQLHKGSLVVDLQ